MRLQDLVQHKSARTPHAVAVNGPDATLTYGALDALANRVAAALASLGVRRGDRVAIWTAKSTRAIAAMQGILRLGAAYVPVDPLSPTPRAEAVMSDCGIAAMITDATRVHSIVSPALQKVPALTLDGLARTGISWQGLASFPDRAPDDSRTTRDDLAYILYTSGSTGTPKGVCISHRNALAFVEWTVEELAASASDRFSNHAPFHFDLSVLDIYGAFLAGGQVSIIPEALSYSGKGLVEFTRAQHITVWYSVPTVLVQMMDAGDLSEASLPDLRAILFAGEVFPIRELRRLRGLFSKARLLNLYGPTETNVCTYYEVSDVPDDQTKPVPIGKAASSDRVWAVNANGAETGVGEEGELLVDGPTVMLGYWGRQPQERTYRTGDIVVLRSDGNYDFIGRRDHQVKVRGHRIELGDIEAALLLHPQIKEAAVVVAGADVKARLVAYISCDRGEPPSLLAIKQHCADRLPPYMIVHKLRVMPSLPRTSNGKINRVTLKQMSETESQAVPSP